MTQEIESICATRRFEHQLHNGVVLARYRPTFFAVIMAALGGASVDWNLEYFLGSPVYEGSDIKVDEILAWTSHGAVITGALLTFGVAFCTSFAYEIYKSINAKASAVNESNKLVV